MLSIFADALLIAAGIGRLPPANKRRGTDEFHDVDTLRTVDTLRQPLR